VTGTARDGGTLTADPGTWSATGLIQYAYKWRRCDASGGSCADVPGATQQTYTLQPADVGTTMVVAVTASNPVGSSTATSAATPVVQAMPPANTAAPTISGTAVDGQTLSADVGSWSGTAPLLYSYQWRRCDATGGACADVDGATTPTYTVRGGDVGSTFRVAVTGSNSAGNSTAISSATPVVQAIPPVNTALPTISGTAADGQTLSADVGSWSGTAPLLYSYQWRRCDATGGACADIDGAATSTYAVTTADAGSTLRVAVTASNSAGSSTAASDATAPVP
jgi:hypothetical protein